MNILPLYQAWLLMILLQFTPFTGEETAQRYVFQAKQQPDIRFVIDVHCPKNPLNQPVLAATGYFTGPIDPVGSLTAVVLGFGTDRTLMNIEGADGIDLVKPGTRERLPLFPGKIDRLVLHSGNELSYATGVSERGTDPTSVEFRDDLLKAKIIYRRKQGVTSVCFTMSGKELEFVAKPPVRYTPAPIPGVPADGKFRHAIVRDYRGLISASLSLEPGKGTGTKPAKPEILLIDTQKAYQQFVSRIYPHVVSKIAPDQKSEDPLLKLPVIDFLRERLIVILAHDGMYGDLMVVNLEEQGRALNVTGRVDPPSREQMGMQQPLGVGRYRAFVLRSPAKKINLRLEGEN